MQSLPLWGRVEYSRLLLGSVFCRQGFGLYLEVANSLRMTSNIKKMLLYHMHGVCVHTRARTMACGVGSLSPYLHGF